MGMDLYVTDERDLADRCVALARDLKEALLADDGYLRPHLDSNLVGRLEPDYSDFPEQWKERDPTTLKKDLGAVRAFVVARNGDLPVQYWFTRGDGLVIGSGAVFPFRAADFTDPSERFVRLVADHGDPNHTGEIQVVYLRPHPDAVRWVRRYQNRSLWERRRDKASAAWTLWRGPIPNRTGGAPDPPRPHFEEVEISWLPVQPIIELLGERIRVQREDAVAQCVPSLDQAIAVCERAGRAGRPVFWVVG